MEMKAGLPDRIPHLTPESLVGQRFGRDSFEGIKVALVGFCPRPDSLDTYDPQVSGDQYFIHLPPASVEICTHGDTKFLALTHVYGGPVASATIEELAYYGIQYVLAFGLAGGLGTKGLAMGSHYLVESALALDGTTPHYTGDKEIPSDGFLNSLILEQAEKNELPPITRVKAVTTDAIYREYDEELASARENGCDIINCDSAHLYAVCRSVDIQGTQIGVLSDAAGGDGEEWDSDLSVMLSAGDHSGEDPISRVGKLVDFYVEAIIPKLI